MAAEIKKTGTPISKEHIARADKAAKQRAIDEAYRNMRASKTVAFLREIDSKEAQERADKIEEQERIRKLPIQQQIEATANSKELYRDDKLQQGFPCLRSIKAVGGFIVIEMDEEKSRKIALEKAHNTLGIMAKPEEIFEYVERTRGRSTIMSVAKFKAKLAIIAHMAGISPMDFGTMRGGSELPALFEESNAVIKQAIMQLKKMNKGLSKATYDILTGGTFSTSDPAEFDRMFGDDWKKSVSAEEYAGIRRVFRKF